MLKFASGCFDDLDEWRGWDYEIAGGWAMSLRLVCRDWRDVLERTPAFWAWLLGAAADTNGWLEIKKGRGVFPFR